MKIFTSPARVKGNQLSPLAPNLRADDLFGRKNGREIYIKKMSSEEKWIPRKGPVVMAAGIACNGNLFRVTPEGEAITLGHARSFANLLASQGFDVYIWHYSSSQRVYNRYVTRFCENSLYFGQQYRTPSTLTFDQMVNQEMPLVLDLVAADSESENISWIGFSLGGMLAYAYLSKHQDGRIRNLVTIGSPVSITHVVAKLIAQANGFSRAIGFEARTPMGRVSERFDLLGSIASRLPRSLLKFDTLVGLLYNPDNVRAPALRTFFGKIVEPIPSGLEHSFGYFIRNGFASLAGDFNYLDAMRTIKERELSSLFFFGQDDRLATPDSVRLAHEIISPTNQRNIIGLNGFRHNDLVIGHRSDSEVWEPALDFLIRNA
ncbi:MAG: hypothetical protein ABIH22_02535 [Candidatus Margulisiibacteriota bacterium]